MKFFLDNTLPPKFAKAINALETPVNRVVHLTEKFPANAPDIVWIQILGKEGKWTIISGDLRISKNPHERRAWQSAKLTTFFLKGWTQQPFWIQASRLIHWWPDIVEQASRVAAGAAFIVPFKYSGRFEQLRFTA